MAGMRSLTVVFVAIVMCAHADKRQRDSCSSEKALASSSGCLMQAKMNAHSNSKVKSYDECTEHQTQTGAQHAYKLAYREFNCPVAHQTLVYQIRGSAREFSAQIPASAGLTMMVFQNTESDGKNCSDFRTARQINGKNVWVLVNGSEGTLNGGKFFANADNNESIGYSWVSSVGEARSSSSAFGGSGGESFLVLVQAGPIQNLTGCPLHKKFRLEIASHGDTNSCPSAFDDLSCTVCAADGCGLFGAFGESLRGSSFAVSKAWEATQAGFRIASNSLGGLAPDANAPGGR